MTGKPGPDLTGRTFGQWTVEAQDPEPTTTSRHTYWLVVCTCGNEGSVRATDLMSGMSYRCKKCSYGLMRRNPTHRGQGVAMTEIELSEEAEDRLINADIWVGGALGVAAPENEESTRKELRAAGLIGRKGSLTTAGVIKANKLYRAYWNE